jgi:hypothetical protein
MADFDQKAFLDSLKLTPDQAKAFEDVLGDPEKGKILKDSVMMKPDYSRAMNKLKEAEVALQTKEQQILTHETELIGWKGDADKTLKKYQDDLEKLQQDHFKAQQKLQNVAQTYGIDPSELGVAGTVTPPASTVNQPKYVTEEQYHKSVQDVMQFPLVAAEIADLQAEHAELFGKSLRNSKDLVTKALKEKKTLRDTWLAEYKVEDTRKEMDLKQRQEEIQLARTDERQKVLSEVKMPVTREGAPVPPAFAVTSHPKPPNERVDALQAAIDSYNKRTYAPQQ